MKSLTEFEDLIVSVLGEHSPAISGDCTCGEAVDHGGDIHEMYRHQAHEIVTRIMQQGTGIPPNEPYAATEPVVGLKVYFNPFLFTIEQNNEFLAQGYEVMPIAIPKGE